ncbi:cysteine-rich CWC family protein [Tepidimonas charontis]|uniref:Cysteine-rich CWC n=1 Tax=Tepidimonas charontis TaxID=2267262 RepID=A0A554XIF9_9BURK|nr:cysteine-rich CWC family protein [Tepidimonas charontis]TSE35624.1 Cysteine-rich CWC [Tepidimonas charontis]
MSTAQPLPGLEAMGAVDPALCPLCGGPNDCALERQRRTGAGQPPCWCTQVRFAPAVLARVPAPARGRACVCARCAAGDDPAAS